jgi:nucleoside-diphosphate-sugar epimerase
MIWCESNRESCFYNNVRAPVALYKRISSVLRDSVFIQISSGCIWDGPYNSNGFPFESNTPPEPQCVYTESKVQCEKELAELHFQNESTTPLRIFRPRLIFSEVNSPRNLLCKLLKYENLIDDYNSFTSCNTIRRCVHGIAENIRKWSYYHSFHGFRIHNAFDIGVSTPYSIAMKLHEAGLRAKPNKLDKSGLDSWHKPKRVNVIMRDPEFEELYQPDYLEITLDNCIKSLALKLKGE